MFYYTVIPRSYVVGGSETGIIRRDDVSRVTFSLKRNIKMWVVVPDNLFWPKGNYLHIKNLHKILKLQMNGILRSRHFLLNCRRVRWIVMSDNTGGDERVPDKITRRNWALNSCEMTFSYPSKAPHNKPASSQFLIQLLLLACSSQCPKTPRCQLQSAQALQPTSQPSWPTPCTHRLSFLSFFKGALLQNFNRNRWGWAPDHGSAETRKTSSFWTFKLACLA